MTPSGGAAFEPDPNRSASDTPDGGAAALRLVARREHALRALADLSRHLSDSGDLHQAAEALLLNLMGQVGCTVAGLWLQSGDQGPPVMVSAHGLEHATGPPLISACWTPLMQHFDRDPRPLASDQVPGGIGRSTELLARQARVALFAPLRADGRTLGLVVLGPRAGGQPYATLDLEVLEASLAIAGGAIRNASLRARVLESNRQLRIANRDLRDLDRLKSEFLDNVNHDLRTPLTVVIACLDCLGSEPVSERGRQLLDEASSNSRKLLDLIEELMGYSSFDQNRLALELVEADLAEFLEGYVVERRPGISGGLRQLHLEIDASRTRVRFDSRRLRSVLDALVDNAVRVTPQGSTVWLQLLDHVDEGAAWVRIDVRDDGPGISPDGSGTQDGGMGLAMAEKLAAAMGGRLLAESEPGRESYSVLLPAA